MPFCLRYFKIISRNTRVCGTHSTIPCSSFNGTTEYVRISIRQKRPRSRLTKLSSTRLNVLFQQFVDDAVKFHETSVFPEIVFRLYEERIAKTICATHRDFSGFLHGVHDFNFIVDTFKSVWDGSREYREAVAVPWETDCVSSLSGRSVPAN
jgi:hypothetical protein